MRAQVAKWRWALLEIMGMWSIYVNLVHLSNSEDVFLGKGP
jgi:hypothetical protein